QAVEGGPQGCGVGSAATARARWDLPGARIKTGQFMCYKTGQFYLLLTTRFSRSLQHYAHDTPEKEVAASLGRMRCSIYSCREAAKVAKGMTQALI
ncbi:MAG: hypothetical protein OXB94_13065, partial [Nitrospira sp.]|nr:hypothetical protein [Nitrospira sp.]